MTTINNGFKNLSSYDNVWTSNVSMQYINYSNVQIYSNEIKIYDNDVVLINTQINNNTLQYINIKFPRQPATSENYTYSDGTSIRITGSRRLDASHTWYRVFDNDLTSGSYGWASPAEYNASTGNIAYTSRTAYAGDWIMIDLGESIVLQNYRIYPRGISNRVPRNLRLYASSDANCWNNINHASLVLIDERTDIPNYTSLVYGEFAITGNTTPYRFYAMVCNRNYGDAYMNPIEIEYYGNYPNIDYGKDAFILSGANKTLSLPRINWSTYPNMQISGWLKTTNLATNDKLIDFDYTYYPDALDSDTTIQDPFTFYDASFAYTANTSTKIGTTNRYYYEFKDTTKEYKIRFLQDTVCDILVVGGGGSGVRGYQDSTSTSYGYLFGGNAGQYQYWENQTITKGDWVFRVGIGGTFANQSANSGTLSYFKKADNTQTYTSAGGGAGLDYSKNYPTRGWNNGAYYEAPVPQGSPLRPLSIIYNTGNIGGYFSEYLDISYTGGYNGNGEGNNQTIYIFSSGATPAKYDITFTAGNGRDGIDNSITTTTKKYAAGGGGALYINTLRHTTSFLTDNYWNIKTSTYQGSGGTGGGGAGSRSSNGSNATANTGSGGGSCIPSTGTPGSGGSGIIIIRYRKIKTIQSINNILIKATNSTNISFQINNTSLNSAAITNDTWLHFLWNISQKYVLINGNKNTYSTSTTLLSGNYTNTVGAATNIGSLYFSNLKILKYAGTTTTTIDTQLYAEKPVYNTLTNAASLSTSIANLSQLYYNTSKKLETNAAGVAVNGNVSVSGFISPTPSDIRLKTIIENIDAPLEKIMRISGFKYFPNDLAKSLAYTEDREQVGLSAQDVQAILPEIVELAPLDSVFHDDGTKSSKSGNNYLTICYEYLVPLLIECIKELKKQLEFVKRKRSNQN
jgi:hypothetical protein